jgi:hypothetical protein
MRARAHQAAVATRRLKAEMPDFRGKYDAFLGQYNAESTIQKARTTYAEFNNLLADIGDKILPGVNKARPKAVAVFSANSACRDPPLLRFAGRRDACARIARGTGRRFATLAVLRQVHAISPRITMTGRIGASSSSFSFSQLSAT